MAPGAGDDPASGFAADGTTETETVGTETASGRGLSAHLDAGTVRPLLSADGKEAAIREMASLLANSGRVTDADGLVRAVLAREDLGTTGLGDEIAVPHARTGAVAAPVVGFARSAEGIDWGSPDGSKARLVFMIAVPEAAAGDEHLRILAQRRGH